MKYYNSYQEIYLTRDRLVTAWQFAKRVAETTNYADTNQLKTDKIRLDHFTSKVGEEAAKDAMINFAQVQGPDYNIYDVKQKSWDADLFINSLPLAVKTQKLSAALRYGLSWTFQYGTFRKDIILNQPEAWVVFVEYDDINLQKNKCRVFVPLQIKELTFEEPKLDYLKGHKKVFYSHSLPGHFV